MTTQKSTGSGCLQALGILYLLVVTITVLARSAIEPSGAGVFAGIMVWGLFAGLPIWLYVWLRKRAKRKAQEAEELRQRQIEAAFQERWSYLERKFGAENARKIMAGNVWVGCTYEMLIETLGQPVATDETVLKTKIKRTYKYRPTGANRYALRIFVEDGEVVGWENKEE